MTKKDVIVREDLFGTNKKIASEIREALSARGILAVNFLSSPGAGKTSLLERIAERMRGEARIAVIEGDIETERDAERIRAKGVPAWQITTGGACHLEAKMVAKVLPNVDPAIEYLFIENVGNLVCPAGYELGEHVRCVLLSAPEGDDKPKKYPRAFTTSDALVLTKSDLFPHLPFDPERAAKEALELNPRLKVFVTSAVRDEGIDALISFFREARAGLVRHA